tara:strand:- start:402 stop:1211 length:810 start_codon:yes stop_codon:yes gene_type:complete
MLLIIRIYRTLAVLMGINDSKNEVLLNKGKVKYVYATDNAQEAIIEYTDKITAFNSKKCVEYTNKGNICCAISACLFELLEGEGIPTHYIGLVDDHRMLVDKSEVIPLEVVVRNIATGSLCKELPIKEFSKLVPALIDFYYKDDALNDPFISEERISLLNIATVTHVENIKKYAKAINEVLSKFFNEIGITLVDFKVEFGFNKEGKIILIDEISPDNCRLWDWEKSINDEKSLDKDIFRQDKDGLIEAYATVLWRIKRICLSPHVICSK